MAKVLLAHSPSLTKEKLKDIFASHFKDAGYEVGLSSLIGTDIYIKKSGWVGVAVRIRQKSDSTILVFNGYAPSVAVRLLLYGLITILILYPKWKKLEREVNSFVTSTEFKIN